MLAFPRGVEEEARLRLKNRKGMRMIKRLKTTDWCELNLRHNQKQASANTATPSPNTQQATVLLNSFNARRSKERGNTTLTGLLNPSHKAHQRQLGCDL